MVKQNLPGGNGNSEPGATLRPATRSFLLLVACLAIQVVSCAPDPPSEAEIDIALDEAALGEDRQAVSRLERLVDVYPTGRIGDRAALVLGNLLISRRQHADAVAPLSRAIGGVTARNYAALLFAHAVIEGRLAEHFDEARGVLDSVLQEAYEPARDLVREEATYLRVRLNGLTSRPSAAAADGRAYLRSWEVGRFAWQVKWLTAEAELEQGRSAEARALYAEIWRSDPASQWGELAKGRLSRDEHVQIGASMTPVDHLAFVAQLRAGGLHDDALRELASFMRRGPSPSQLEHALALQARSQYQLRLNEECVQTVERMRDQFPGSRRLPATAIYAIRALRRSDDAPRIREWANWVASTYPGSQAAIDARYNLGSFLSNVVSLEEGANVLAELTAEFRDNPTIGDALWKLAWTYRNLGQTDDAVETMQRITLEYEDSSLYRAALYWIARFTVERDPDGARDRYLTLVERYPHDYYGHQSMDNLLAMGVRPDRIGFREELSGLDFLTDPTAGPPGNSSYTTAVYLKRLGLYGFAAAELESIPPTEYSPGMHFALAYTHSRSGNPWKAIEIVGQQYQEFVSSGSRDPGLVPREFWHVVFPYRYRAAIEESIRESRTIADAGIEPYLLAALIRMESLFLPTAVSPVGAVGLMQLMPNTARGIAEEHGLPEPSRADLFDPVTNIRFGTYYLAQRVEDFQGDWFPAICSYNAGIGPVRGWWGAKPPNQDIDEFIENIPYLATRAYIKRILADFRNYEWLYRSN